jgi:DNA polymerase III alpha subunit (gram-positive type)
MKYFLYYDLETTGVEPNKDEIVQFSAIIEDLDGNIITEIDMKARPTKPELIKAGVPELLGTTVEELMSRPLSQEQLYENIVDFFNKHIDKYDKNDKFIPVGYNIDFDNTFMRSFFMKHHNRYLSSYFHFYSIDVMSFSHIFLIYGKLPSSQYDLKLETMCNYAGIPLEKAHDSLYDTHAVRKLLKWFENHITIDYEFEGCGE